MKSRILLSLLLSAAITCASLAWDTPGHEQVADMAYSLLNDGAKGKIREILKHGDPSYVPSDASDAALRDAFRRAASFPDRIKGDMGTAYESVIPSMNLKWQPDLQPAELKGELVRCKTWHYYDTPIHFQGVQPVVRPSNALVAYTFARQRIGALKNSTDPAELKESAWWLYWIEHLTGDLHQPLHCTSNYQTIPGGDAGANLFHVKVPDPKHPGNTKSITLHSYWDEGIDHAAGGDRQPLKDLDANEAKTVTDLWLAEPAIQPSAAEVANLAVADWIAKGAEFADSKVYDGITDGKEPNGHYAARQIEFCKRQAVLAAKRLAAILNNTLSP